MECINDAETCIDIRPVLRKFLLFYAQSMVASSWCCCICENKRWEDSGNNEQNYDVCMKVIRCRSSSKGDVDSNNNYRGIDFENKYSA